MKRQIVKEKDRTELLQSGLGLKLPVNHFCIVGLGDGVGDVVGITVGLTVGPTVGETVGDGDSVGLGVGETVGLTVGETVGDAVRRGVGVAVRNGLEESFSCAVVKKVKAGLDTQAKTAKMMRAANHGCFREFLFFILLPSFYLNSS